jgi:hypothetical protein
MGKYSENDFFSSIQWIFFPTGKNVELRNEQNTTPAEHAEFAELNNRK